MSAKWQAKLRTGRSARALESIKSRLSAKDDAEAVRHALRIMANLLEVGEESTLLLVNEKGETQSEDPFSEPFDHQSWVADNPDDARPLRRWTMFCEDGDIERAQLIQDSYGGVPRTVVIETAIVHVGELLSRLDESWRMWAEPEDGDAWALVVL